MSIALRLNTNIQASQAYSTSQSTLPVNTVQESGGAQVNDSLSQVTDRVTISSRGEINQGEQTQPLNNAESSQRVEGSGEPPATVEATAGDIEILRAEGNETVSEAPPPPPPPPEEEIPVESELGSTETLESTSAPQLQTVVPIANGNDARQNTPQVQLTSAGVYTNNPGVALQSSLQAPFTVDQTI